MDVGFSNIEIICDFSKSYFNGGIPDWSRLRREREVRKQKESMKTLFNCLPSMRQREKRLWLEVKWVQGSILKALSMFKHR